MKVTELFLRRSGVVGQFKFILENPFLKNTFVVQNGRGSVIRLNRCRPFHELRFTENCEKYLKLNSLTPYISLYVFLLNMYAINRNAPLTRMKYPQAYAIHENIINTTASIMEQMRIYSRTSGAHKFKDYDLSIDAKSLNY